MKCLLSIRRRKHILPKIPLVTLDNTQHHFIQICRSTHAYIHCTNTLLSDAAVVLILYSLAVIIKHTHIHTHAGARYRWRARVRREHKNVLLNGALELI